MECRFCGLNSERDDVCSWCGKPLAASVASPLPPGAARPPGAPQMGPTAQPPGQAPARARPAPYAGPAAGSPLGPPAVAPPAQTTDRAASARRTTIWALGGAGAVAVAVLVVVIIAARPPRFSASQDMKIFEGTSSFASFSYPADWTAGGYGKSGGQAIGIDCGKGKFARFDLGASMAASLMAEIASTPVPSQPLGIEGDESGGGEPVIVTPRKDPNIRAHEFLAERRHKGNPAWEESEPSLILVSGQSAAVSEFTARRKALFSKVRIKGRRYSFRCGGYTVELLAYCPEKDWPQYLPMVEKMVGGLHLKCEQY